MSKILYIKANAKETGGSRTFKLSDRFAEEYRRLHPEDTIITLDLYQEGIDFLPVGQLEQLHRPNPGEGRNHPILKYAYQFLEADKYIISAPLWNLSIPAILKAYIDYICVTGITFTYTENRPVGLCTGKKAIHITTRGGNYSIAPYRDYEMGDRYLRTILGFLGITDFETIAAEELDVIGNDVDAILSKAMEKAAQAAKHF